MQISFNKVQRLINCNKSSSKVLLKNVIKKSKKGGEEKKGLLSFENCKDE